jgi:hypothetical protein
MPYPDLTYPSNPEFPTGYDWTAPGQELYEIIASYIQDLAADAAKIIPDSFNIQLPKDKAIEWGHLTKISIVDDKLKCVNFQITDGLYSTNVSITTLAAPSLNSSKDLTASTDVSVTGSISNGSKPAIRICHELSEAAEPDDPADNSSVIWLSNGTGYGDQGDLCAKITEGGGTSSFTIVDFSAI